MEYVDSYAIFFFNDTATTEIYTLSLHDALPIYWIDAQLRPGKDSGAFCHPTVPSAHPYVLMSYQGRNRDVMTLAHELGHGVHQVLAARQGLLMASTPLTLAETASVFGEQLTFRALLS